MDQTMIPSITLNNGVKIPQLGLGVFQSRDGEEVEQAVSVALEAGYRLIDTAAAYQNEAGVGNAIRASGLPRSEIFVTTKLWNTDHTYADALRAFDASLEKLGGDYIDLYLIHFPVPMEGKFPQAWKALEAIYESGRAKAIGVSNFLPHHLDQLLSGAAVCPAVNQIQLHPRFQQRETRAYCAARGIAIEAYSPLMRAGEGDVLEHPVIITLAQQYGKTPAQIILRWHVQNGFVVIPKSTRPERIRENIALFDFELSFDEMQAMAGLDDGQSVGVDPETFRGF